MKGNSEFQQDVPGFQFRGKTSEKRQVDQREGYWVLQQLFEDAHLSTYTMYLNSSLCNMCLMVHEVQDIKEHKTHDPATAELIVNTKPQKPI